MGPKIGMYSKNWVGQVHFENFDFLIKVKVPLSQSIFSFPFFFFFQAVRTGSPIRVGFKEPGQAESGKWHHHDVIELEGRVWAREPSWRRVGGPNRRVWAREMTLLITGPSGGAWQRVAHRLWPKFLGFVDRSTVDLLVLSVFWNLEHICTGLKDEAAISEACSRAWRRVLAPVILIFQGFINWSPFKVLVGSVLWNDLWIFTNLEESRGWQFVYDFSVLFFCGAALTRWRLYLDLRVVGDELPFSVWYLSFQPLVQSSLILSAECRELAKSDFKL